MSGAPPPSCLVQLPAGELGAAETTHPVNAYMAGLSARSRRTMLGAMETIAVFATNGEADVWSFPWHQLRYEHAAAIRAGLMERYSNISTINLHLAALRGVLRACWRLRLMDAETYHLAVSVPSVKSETLPRGRSLDRGEITALFATCAQGTTSGGRRDAAMLAVWYGAWLRRAEAVGLDVTDYEPEAGGLAVRCGKG